MRQDATVTDGVVERTVRISSDGASLAGVVSRPDGVAPGSRAAVLLHGWGTYRCGPHDILVKLARALARAGVATLRFDLRGRGESGGAYEEADLDGVYQQWIEST